MTAARLTIVIDHTHLKGLFVGVVERHTYNIADENIAAATHALDKAALDNGATPTYSKTDKHTTR